MSDLRKRLNAILRARAAPGPEAAAPGMPFGALPVTDAPRDGDARGAAAAAQVAEVSRRYPRSPRRIEEILPGEELSMPRGPCWLGRWSFEEQILDAGGLAAGFEVTRRARAIGAPPAPDDAAPGSVLFLDLETTGFAGVPLFLAGIIETGTGSVEQFFARDYSEEASVVEAVAARIARAGVLVTFNGKSYDVPFLKDRAACHKIALAEPREHLDLLYAARRRWRGVLPDCRLTTIEAHLGGRPRVGDVPGAEIPARYHDSVRRGDPSGLAGVFLHNARDLVTLARLYLRVQGEPAEGD